MTGYPEGWLARELGLCYANVSLITDYDVGVPGDDGGPVSHEAVLRCSPRTSPACATCCSR